MAAPAAADPAPIATGPRSGRSPDGLGSATASTVRMDRSGLHPAVRMPTARDLFDAIGIAEIVSKPSVLIGDNITAKKWATIDTVTPGNKHIRIAYHWIKEHVRDLDIDLRDTPSLENLADFLTKNQTGPAIRSSTDAASGYSPPPRVPDAST